MEVKIKQENRYRLTIDGIEHVGFQLESEWEGMAKFVGPKGVVVVSKPDTFASGIFGEIFGVDPEPSRLVKASPDLLPKPKKDRCTYPSCQCPFDAPADPNWCAKGLPK